RPGTPVALNEKTTVRILSRWEKSAPGSGTIRILRVSRGELWTKAGTSERQLEIETPAAVATGRDAEFDLKVADEGQSAVTVVQGTVDFATPFGQCAVRAGTGSIGARGAACTAPQPANAADAIGWRQGGSPGRGGGGGRRTGGGRGAREREGGWGGGAGGATPGSRPQRCAGPRRSCRSG